MSKGITGVASLLLLAILGGCGRGGSGGNGAPVIDSFTANPASISAPGQAVSLNWTVSGPVTGLTIDQGVGSVSGNNVTVLPTATTTYKLTASNSSGSVEATTTVTIGTGVGPGVEDGLAPKGTFGVSLTQSGPFQSDQGGSIAGPSDPRIIRVQPNSTFYASASYADPGGISSLTAFIANSSPPGLRADLLAGQDVKGFTISEPIGCSLDGTQTNVTCVYQIQVGNIPNITALQGAGSEFAYVLKMRAADPAAHIDDNSTRGYVIVGEGGTTPTPPGNGNGNPVAAFTNEQTASDTSGVTYTFNGAGSTDPNGDSLSYLWNFGDGTGANSRDFTKKYTKDGTYTVTLTVSDGKGGTDSESKSLTVDVPGTGTPGNQNPVANFSYFPTAPVVNGTVTFTSSSADADGTIASYAWTVTPPSGSAKTYSSNPLGLKLSQVGDYKVSLVVTDDDGAKSTAVEKTVAVQAASTPVFSVEIDTPNVGTVGSVVPLTAKTNNAPSSPTTYKWTATGNNPGVVTFTADDAEDTSATFSAPGSYTLTLTATNGTLTASDTESATINPVVEEEELEADFTFSADEQNPKLVDFTSISTGPISSHNWVFGDDGIGGGNGQTTEHLYAAAGTYTVTLTVRDSNGNSDAVSKPVTVN